MRRSVVGPIGKRRPSRSVTGQMPNNALVTNSSSASKTSDSVRSLSSARRPSVRAVSSTALRITPLIPQRANVGVVSTDLRTANRLLLVPPTTWPLASSNSPCCDGVAAQLELREYLLEAAQVLDACERRILAEPQLTDVHADPFAIVGVGIVGPRRYREHARRCCGVRRQIAARTGPARDDELDDGAALVRDSARRFHSRGGCATAPESPTADTLPRADRDADRANGCVRRSAAIVSNKPSP